MMALKAAGYALVALIAGTSGSTCHGQSGSGEVSKEPEAQPDVNLPGLDTSALPSRERKEWSGYVSELLAPCSDVPVSIAQCVTDKRSCSRCMPAAKFILKNVREGFSRDQVEKAYHARFDSDRIKNVPIDGSPFKGPESAPVTLVEFADFTCPHCAAEAKPLDQLWASHKDQIRFVYKFFPLNAMGHERGEIAARSAIAAMDQGKFWEMHDKMFENYEHLDPSDLDSYAKDLGLDIAKFHTDQESDATTAKLKQDRALADSLGVNGTPTIYVNGRLYDPRQELDDWIGLDLMAAGVAPSNSAKALAVAASASGSAHPAPSSSASAAASAKSSSKK